jgi:ABC transporter with metal-binding/Fe-S-binding domain ATP-binding protein
MRVAILSSGGKDSSAAWWWAMCRGWEVTHLVTMIVEGNDSMMFQIPGTEIVGHQAKLSASTWLPIKTQGIEDLEVDELEQSLSNLSIDGLVCGALRSDYQKSRIERMCHRLGIFSYTPLWHQSSLGHITGLVEHGFGVVITSVACDGLDESWLGETLTKQSLAKLIELSEKFRFNVDGEGGEYETLVVYGPHLSGSIKIEGEKQWLGRRGHYKINKISNSFDGFSS